MGMRLCAGASCLLAVLLIVLSSASNSAAHRPSSDSKQEQRSSLWIAKIKRSKGVVDSSDQHHAAALSRVRDHLQRRGIEAHRTHHRLGMLTAHMEAASVSSLLQDAAEDIEYIVPDRQVSLSQVREM